MSKQLNNLTTKNKAEEDASIIRKNNFQCYICGNYPPEAIFEIENKSEKPLLICTKCINEKKQRKQTLEYISFVKEKLQFYNSELLKLKGYLIDNELSFEDLEEQFSEDEDKSLE